MIPFSFIDNTEVADDASGNYSFAFSMDFTRDPVDKITMGGESSLVDEMDFLDKDIDTYCQILFALPDNTKVIHDRSGNYSFANSVDFTRDSVDTITLRDKNYPDIR